MKLNKAVEIYNNHMSAGYKATAIQAAKEMPAEGTLQQQSEYVYDKLYAAHKEKEWGVVLVKYTPGKDEDTTFMWRSGNAS